MDNQEFEQRVFDYLRDNLAIDGTTHTDEEGRVSITIELSLLNPSTNTREIIFHNNIW